MSTYNGEKFIGQAIESILKQTFGDFEFLIIDDASTDLTPLILKDYSQKDQRIKLFINKERQGLTKNLNSIIKTAKGEYIARMDDDDISLPQRFAKQVEFLNNNPKMAMCGTLGFVINQDNETVGEKKMALDYEGIKKRLLFNNQFLHSSLMIRKSVFDELGFYNEKFLKAQDYELAFRVAWKHPVANLADKLVMWRFLPLSLSNKNKDQQKFALKARWLAITEYSYPKLRGLGHILLRLVWLYVPKKIKIRKYS